MAQGSKRLRGSSWELRAYTGIDPTTGAQTQIHLTVPPCNGRPVPSEEADMELARLVARAQQIRSERYAARHRRRRAEVLGLDGEMAQ